jgi:hypothetical protein
MNELTDHGKLTLRELHRLLVLNGSQLAIWLGEAFKSEPECDGAGTAMAC